MGICRLQKLISGGNDVLPAFIMLVAKVVLSVKFVGLQTWQAQTMWGSLMSVKEHIVSWMFGHNRARTCTNHMHIRIHWVRRLRLMNVLAMLHSRVAFWLVFSWRLTGTTQCKEYVLASASMGSEECCIAQCNQMQLTSGCWLRPKLHVDTYSGLNPWFLEMRAKENRGEHMLCFSVKGWPISECVQLVH